MATGTVISCRFLKQELIIFCVDIHFLLHGSKYDMTNIIQVSHILSNYEIAVKI